MLWPETGHQFSHQRSELPTAWRSIHHYSCLYHCIFLVLKNLVWVTVLAVLYFPVFACVEAPIRLVGYIVGLMYTAWL